MKYFIKILFLLTTVLLPLQGETGPEDLTYMTENYPPANYINEYGILEGGAVQLIKVLWREMNCPDQPIKTYPWARGYQNILTREKQVLFSMARTAERDSLFKWVGPLFTSTHSIIGLQANKKTALPIFQKESLSRFRYGVVRKDIGELLLKNNAVPDSQIVYVNQMSQLIPLLKSGEVDYIILGDNALRNINMNSDSQTALYNAYTLKIQELYIAFSKDTPDSLILKFQNALNSIEKEQRAILNEAGMELQTGITK